MEGKLLEFGFERLSENVLVYQGAETLQRRLGAYISRLSSIVHFCFLCIGNDRRAGAKVCLHGCPQAANQGATPRTPQQAIQALCEGIQDLFIFDMYLSSFSEKNMLLPGDAAKLFIIDMYLLSLFEKNMLLAGDAAKLFIIDMYLLSLFEKNMLLAGDAAAQDTLQCCSTRRYGQRFPFHLEAS